MIKLFWNTHNQINPASDDPNREDVFNYKWGLYHKENSNHWIFFLLKKIDYKIISSLDEIKKDEVLIIVDSSIEKKKELYLNLRTICSKIFLFHLGDETGVVDYSNIYSNCDYVWRTFCNNRYFKHKNLNCLPIGYKSGVTYKKQENLRKYKWNFIGTPHKSSRHDLLFQFSEIEPFFVFKTKKFNDKKIIEVDEMSKILSSTHFVPCPNGFVHPETYRLYEALECQSIPIIENSYRYYERLFPGNPLIKIDRWLDAKDTISSWTSEKIEKKRKECNIWWIDYKSRLQNNILEIIKK